jgi:hypothetical protein
LILLLNGAFGIGKSTVARAFLAQVPNGILFDPEIIGIALQQLTRLSGHGVEDFQDLRLWRSLTVAGLKLARWKSSCIVVPMAISNPAYLAELQLGIRRFEPRCCHTCLVAPKSIVHDRLRERGADPIRNSWEFRRASECCEAHASDTFAQHIDVASRNPDEIARELLSIAGIIDRAA